MQIQAILSLESTLEYYFTKDGVDIVTAEQIRDEICDVLSSEPRLDFADLAERLAIDLGAVETQARRL
ncbi:MAG: hypothetical protein SGCHY_003866, partial [Lobulomycetales sp.]